MWLDPNQRPGGGVENVVEELLDPHLPMPAILNNVEKAAWLAEIKLPSQSWFYVTSAGLKHSPVKTLSRYPRVKLLL